MRIVARQGGFWFNVLGSGRTPAWDAAKARRRQDYPNCEMCGLPGGSLGGLDGKPGTQEIIEFHDVKPWHLLTEEEQNDQNFLYENGMNLHHFEHHHDAHCGDPKCLQYNAKIREIGAIVLQERANCTQ
jgi:hypothetical protein